MAILAPGHAAVPAAASGEPSVRASVERRRMQVESVARGLRSGREARRTGDHVDADLVLDKLPRKLDAARTRSGIATLGVSPFTCRKTSQSPFVREMIVPFGRSGSVPLFEIVDETNVAVLAFSHQREDDHH